MRQAFDVTYMRKRFVQQFLRDIIVRAGELTLEYRRKAEELQVDCKSEKDLVTEADRAVEEFSAGRN